jgi:AcrR family transcriptional regulator
MTRGRPRDEAAKARILSSTFELLSHHGSARVSIDDIASAASVGKQTIYRWWPSRSAVVLDALLSASLIATPFPDTDDAEADFRMHTRAVAELFASPAGQLIKQVLADAQANITTAEEFRRSFWTPRRQLSVRRLKRAQREGEVRTDLAIEPALDTLYGPLWLALMIGHRSITRRYADQTFASTWRSWTADPTRRDIGEAP